MLAHKVMFKLCRFDVSGHTKRGLVVWQTITGACNDLEGVRD